MGQAAAGVCRLSGRLLAAGVLLLALTGCGTGPPARTQPSSPAASVISTADLVPGEAVPAPRGAPVLTLSGRIAAHNRGQELALDLATLDRLGVRRVSLYEPWTKQTMQFQGVWLSDLLRMARVDGSATGIHLTALDDYRVDLSMAEIRAGGILVATRSGDGTAIPVDQGGPARIVFVGDVPTGRNADRWIWSLKALDVR